jgi:hypothetical protein
MLHRTFGEDGQLPRLLLKAEVCAEALSPETYTDGCHQVAVNIAK